MLSLAKISCPTDARGMTLAPSIGRLDAIARLESVRMAMGVKKGAFAASLGIHAPNYSRLLKGEFFLTADQLYTVWQLYGADPAYILGGRTDGAISAGLLQKIQKASAQ